MQEGTMQSQHYQLIKLASDEPPPGRWDQQLNALVIDLMAFKSIIAANPDIPPSVRSFIAELTGNYTRSFELRNSLQRDDTVYFSDYWTREDSMLSIVEYKKLGTSKDLTPYLGPLANIPTASYGEARFELRYKGEVLSFWGGVQKQMWSLRPAYWSAAGIFLPVAAAEKADIAIISQAIPTNYLESKATYLLLPRL